MYDLESDYSRTGVHGIRWVYTSLRLDLLFVDQTGFGRFRMTPEAPCPHGWRGPAL